MYRVMLATAAGEHIGDSTVRLTCWVCCLQGELAATPGSIAEQPVKPAATSAAKQLLQSLSLRQPRPWLAVSLLQVLTQ